MRLRSGLPPQARQPAVLAAFVLVQAIAAVFFLGDALTELISLPLGVHSLVETITALTLLLGVVFGTIALRQMLERMRAQDAALAVASGALAQVIDSQFAAWRLTPAEREVGLLALKGFDVAEIAGMRRAAQGTVRAQLTRIYAKAGVTGRAQFAAFFVEDLLVDGVADPRRPQNHPSPAQDPAQVVNS